MWIESLSTLHVMKWRGELRPEQAEPMRDRLLAAPVSRCEPDGLGYEVWKVADELGGAKTYDANYVALARLLKCRLVTLDARMRRGTARLGFVVGRPRFEAAAQTAPLPPATRQAPVGSTTIRA